jgi:hypothetical protein
MGKLKSQLLQEQFTCQKESTRFCEWTIGGVPEEGSFARFQALPMRSPELQRARWEKAILV